MATRNPNPLPNPAIRTVVALLTLVALSAAGAGREHLPTLDAGFSWAAPAATCSGSGPLADVAANAAAQDAPCASPSTRSASGSSAASFALRERAAPSLAR